jgi:hypothetical protein
MSRYRTSEILLVALFTACVSFQLFVPPAIGLANNGDFAKMIGRFSLAPGSLDTSEEYKYFTAHWAYNRAFYWLSDDRSSELIPISAAVLTGWWFSVRVFDIRTLGAIHALLWIVSRRFVLCCGLWPAGCAISSELLPSSSLLTSATLPASIRFILTSRHSYF